MKGEKRKEIQSFTDIGEKPSVSFFIFFPWLLYLVGDGGADEEVRGSGVGGAEKQEGDGSCGGACGRE